MSQERDATIESVSQPVEPNSPACSTTTSEQAKDPKETAHEESSALQSKGKGKRKLSISLPQPTAKRPAKSVFNYSGKNSYAYNDPSLSRYTIWRMEHPDENSEPYLLRLTYHTGDIFDARPGTLLIHACNTQGHWGAGIAKTFKTKYPKAYAVHHKFCTKEHSQAKPVPTGTAQLIAPVDSEDSHWIGCLFTSAKYGKAKDTPEQILKNTSKAMRMLLKLVRIADEEKRDGNGVAMVRMCRINSGKFGVPWEKTEEALKGTEIGAWMRGFVEVWEPPAE